MALLRRAEGRPERLLPGFTDIVEIGIGSLATVYRAREIGTNRLVALKLLNVRDASPRAHRVVRAGVDRAGRGELAPEHRHPVPLVPGPGRPAGARPRTVLRRGRRPDARRHRAARRRGGGIGIKVAGALETAHRGGILHRDVKPQNILITEFGEPALADFGVAMLQSSTQTTAGLFDFTTLHAAPELLEGGETSAATDVYELASSLYQLVAGRSAFRAYEGESPASVILRILRDPVQPLAASRVPDRAVRPADPRDVARTRTAVRRPPPSSPPSWPHREPPGLARTQFLVRDLRCVRPRPRRCCGPRTRRRSAWRRSSSSRPVSAEPGLHRRAAGAAPREPRHRRAPPHHRPRTPAAAGTQPAPVRSTRSRRPRRRPSPVPSRCRPGRTARPPPSRAQSAAPQSVSDLALDPMALRRRVTLRAGARAMVVDESGLALRQTVAAPADRLAGRARLRAALRGRTGSGGGRLVARDPRRPARATGHQAARSPTCVTSTRCSTPTTSAPQLLERQH